MFRQGYTIRKGEALGPRVSHSSRCASAGHKLPNGLPDSQARATCDAVCFVMRRRSWIWEAVEARRISR